jgi:hypothetical protein
MDSDKKTEVADAQNEDSEFTLDDLGEVEDPKISTDQMKKFMSYVNGKLSHLSKQGKQISKRRTKNQIAKKSRKKNRKK